MAAPASDDRYVRDKRGKAHAVFEDAILRDGRMEAFQKIDMHQCLTLMDAAARILRSIPRDALAVFPDDVRELAGRQGSAMRRLVYGEVPKGPIPWLGRGWDAGIAQFDNGIVIDHIEAATGDEGSGLWLLFLHRMGWHGTSQSLLRARRWYWREHAAYAYEMVHESPEDLLTKGVPTHRFVSVLGESPHDRGTDVLWASRWAIDEILLRTARAMGISLKVQDELKAVECAVSPDSKGKSLERLMRSLFESVDGFSVRECNAHTETEEIDLVLDNKSGQHPWTREGALILVECKNWSNPCGKDELVLFEAKIKNRRERCTVAFFVAWNGFTSTTEKELLRSSREGWLMVLLDGARVRKAVQTGDFMGLIEDAWYEALKR